jgi:hypothetical protein
LGYLQSTDAKRLKYGEKTHGELAVVPLAVPPPIPSRKVANDAYSGVKQDTVGPALYNPKLDIQKHTAPKVDFVASKSRRTVFEQENRRENILPAKDNPGPGKYDAAG